MSKWRITAVIGFMLITVACSENNNPTQSKLLTGTPFPMLTLTDFNAQTTSLKTYQGKLVVLNIWAPWCGPCLEEMPSLQRLHNLLDQKRFSVIGLTVDDDRYLAEEFLIKHNIDYPNYIDQGKHIVKDILNVQYYPQTFIIGRNGTLLMHDTGYRLWDSPDIVNQLEQFYYSDIN